MKLGLQIVHFKTPNIAAGVAEVARTAEDAGFASLWVLDHLFQMEGAGPIDEPMLEAYTTLGYLAGVTRRMILGVTVTGVIYRYPGVLIKTLTTLDVLSGGRAWLGIGAAWYEREARALGIPFPSTSTRFEWLEETLQIAHRMWSDDNSPYEGKHFQLAEPLNSPQPIQKPHPPIMIGGMGEQKTLRLVAQYADACNFDFPIGIENLRHKLDVLRGHCDAVGRDYDTIQKTAVGGVGDMTSAQLADTLGQVAELGFSHVMVNMPEIYSLTSIERIGREVIPALEAM